jgi:hypothetical protein
MDRSRCHLRARVGAQRQRPDMAATGRPVEPEQHDAGGLCHGAHALARGGRAAAHEGEHPVVDQREGEGLGAARVAGVVAHVDHERRTEDAHAGVRLGEALGHARLERTDGAAGARGRDHADAPRRRPVRLRDGDRRREEHAEHGDRSTQRRRERWRRRHDGRSGRNDGGATHEVRRTRHARETRVPRPRTARDGVDPSPSWEERVARIVA